MFFPVLPETVTRFAGLTVRRPIWFVGRAGSFLRLACCPRTSLLRSAATIAGQSMLPTTRSGRLSPAGCWPGAELQVRHPEGDEWPYKDALVNIRFETYEQ